MCCFLMDMRGIENKRTLFSLCKLLFVLEKFMLRCLWGIVILKIILTIFEFNICFEYLYKCGDFMSIIFFFPLLK